MSRKLFCEISPLTYKISVARQILKRNVRDAFSHCVFAMEKCSEELPVLIYSHDSMIRRKLGNVNMDLQNGKAVNLSIVTPKVNKVIIRPGETFSFWKLVGSTDAKKGYKDGLQIANGKLGAAVGGGMCQFTNLIHWLILHSPVEIVEHHHHDKYDLFPDCNRKVPFGTGTSILYNYQDYRFYNPTENTFQIVVYVTDEYLCGELRSDKDISYSYNIEIQNEEFVKETDGTYRCGEVFRSVIDKATGDLVEKSMIRKNHALLLYELK